ncbi:MAG: aspartate aminotransferase family protein [Rhodothermales bacterium]|nr:aspartate aminotransferase family protein [Rhodothermales bacterium]MBO6779306.1 aspartate aminotransferase family protein [Rhodothermales bacterium]
MAGARNLIERRNAMVPAAVGQFAGEMTAVSASGARITDAEGRVFIDFAGGIGVMTVGHCAPEVVQAIKDQAEKLIHTSIHVASYEPYVALCEKLADLFPHGDRTRVILINSGAEAVENAIKLARQATGRPGVICFSEAFHGRTLMALSLTSKTKYKTGCGPLAPEVYRLPYPNHFMYGDGLSEAAFVQRELDRLEAAFLNMVPSDQVAAVILEPVQGEGGFAVAPPAYLQGLRRICDEHGIMLILDEVQSGFCRTGRWAAYEHAGIVPDLSTWAKAMGGGMPISAVVGKASVMEAAAPSTVGGTYGGNPVACAASLAAIGIMERCNLNARAVEVGGKIRACFERLQRATRLVADIRGLGAMLAMELCEHGDRSRPAGDAVRAVCAACRERGLIVLPSGAHGNVIRILVPLVISDAELDQGLAILEESVLAVAVPVV